MGSRKGDAGAGTWRVEQPQSKKTPVSGGKEKPQTWRKLAGEM